jgi:UDP-N-acetylmuramate dehydrogenase
LECLAGVPATVGGAIRMNAGGKFGSIGPAVRRVLLCDARGHVHHRERDDLVFGYRTSNITDASIIEAELELNRGGPDELRDRVKEIMALKKQSQPLADHSAGCAFKNPIPAPNRERLSAGQLIDRAGLKGFRICGAEVSPQHANFVVAHHGCKAADVLELFAHVKQRVHDRFGILLEQEVVVWP